MSEITITKKQRLQLWRRVQQSLTSYINRKEYIYNHKGLCNFVQSAANNEGLPYSYMKMRKKTFPEAFKYKPKTGWAGCHRYWWSPNKKRSHEHRLAVVNKIIQDLEAAEQ